ncbi:MAG TPA: MgtC/SapB family protein [Acetobacteraceae bacterium]|jgi:putative Mg2+ transporter-C (MgtC) family protein|nr:MgtC/SapB family protein [Acetobacteraceae bacterium]
MGPTLTWGDIFVRLALTLVAGVLIGLDRNQHAHPAGLRTTVLIALAAAVAMIQANWLTTHTVDLHNQTLRADIMRLPLGSLDGVGFIGAGVILRLWMEA